MESASPLATNLKRLATSTPHAHPSAIPSLDVTLETSTSNSADSSAAAVSVSEPIPLVYYSHATKHYQWVRKSQASRDWRLRLQVFLEDWRSSNSATAFTCIVALAIFGQIIMILVETSSFSITQVNACGVFVSSMILTSFFTLELLLRTISRTSMRDLFTSTFWWVDLFSVLPEYIVLLIARIQGIAINPCGVANFCNGLSSELSVLADLMRVLRLLRLLKVARLSPDTAVLARAMYLSTRSLLVPLSCLIIGSFFFGALVYYVEHFEVVIWRRSSSDLTRLFETTSDANNCSLRSGASAEFPDVGAAIWFMIVTFTTVGYGDISPDGHLAKFVTVLAMFCGVILLAMPIAIVGTNFTTAWDERSKMQVQLSIQKKCIENQISFNGIRSLFMTADEHHTGAIDFLEFRSFLGDLGINNVKPSEVRRLFKLFDEGSSGGITFVEFCHFVFPDLDVELMLKSAAQLDGDDGKAWAELSRARPRLRKSLTSNRVSDMRKSPPELADVLRRMNSTLTRLDSRIGRLEQAAGIESASAKGSSESVGFEEAKSGLSKWFLG